MNPLRLLFMLSLAVSATRLHAGELVYTVRDLGALGGANSRAHAINEYGWVVGEAETGAGLTRAFLWTPDGGMRELGTLGGDISRAYAINDRGHVAGEAEDAEGRMRPFRWQADSGMEPLPLPDAYRDGFVFGMNNYGVLVGGGENEQGTRALIWTVDGVSVPEPLRPLGSSLAFDVNDLGDYVGQVEDLTGADYVSRAFLVSSGRLFFPAARESPEWSSAAMALTADGQAVGYAERSNATHAMRFDAAQPAEDLDTLANVYSVAYDVNESGVAVGLFVSSHEDDDRAFVHRGGAMADLNELLETDEPWLIVEARGINRRGQIVGYGLLRERERAVLLDPKPIAEGPRARIRISEPAAGATFLQGYDVWLEAVVDPGPSAIRRVTFLSSGVVLGTATSAPYRLRWAQPPAGTHHLVALAVDQLGRLHRSPRAPLQVRLRESEKPSVVLLEPDDGTALCVGSNLWISAEAPGAEQGRFTLDLLFNGAVWTSTNATAIGTEWRPMETGLYAWAAVLRAPDGPAMTSATARVHVTAPDDL